VTLLTPHGDFALVLTMMLPRCRGSPTSIGRNYLNGHHGDRVNAFLWAIGYNFRLILSRLKPHLQKSSM
jgi:hypothetical protein